MSDYTKRRQRIIDALPPDERKVFDEAYATAGLSISVELTS